MDGETSRFQPTGAHLRLQFNRHRRFGTQHPAFQLEFESTDIQSDRTRSRSVYERYVGIFYAKLGQPHLPGTSWCHPGADRQRHFGLNERLIYPGFHHPTPVFSAVYRQLDLVKRQAAYRQVFFRQIQRQLT